MKEVFEVLIKSDVVKGKFDGSVFYLHKYDEVKGLVFCQVGDFFWAGTTHFGEYVMNILNKTFKASQE